MSPVPKKSRPAKSDVAPDAANNDSNSGIIRFEVDKVSTLDSKGRFSPIVEVGGVPWRVKVVKDNDSHLSAFLYSISHKSTQWSIDVKAEFILINSDGSKSIAKTPQTITLKHDVINYGLSLLTWKTLMDEEKGFIKDDKITVEIRFSILKTKGIWIAPCSSSPGDNGDNNIAMMKEGKIVLVKKQSLFPSGTMRNSKTADLNSSGFIRFEVDVNDITGTGIFSPVIEVMGVPWALNVSKTGNPAYLNIYLYNRFENDSNIWSIDVSCKINLEGPRYRVSGNLSTTYNHETFNWGYCKYKLWDDVINGEKGFVTDGKITVDARFTISNVIGIRTISRIDFADPNDPRHDLALLIEGEKVYVGKQILAFHSPFFKAMFYGNHIEKNKKEIELKEIDHKVFIEMLSLIYPSYQKINDNNAESLLKMADYFQINIVIDQVEQFLMNSSKWTIPAKLKLSDQYRLVKLQDNCLASFKSVMDVMNLQTSDVYKTLSDKAKVALLDKSMKLSRGN